MDVNLESRKARGAFFTPTAVAQFITSWAIKSKNDVVLEPSCGEAAFLLPVAARLLAAGADGSALKAQVHGQELHVASVRIAEEKLHSEGFEATINSGDFFSRQAEPVFDAVVGNPPYVRFQDFNGASRGKSLEAALAQGVRLNQLASSWAAFTIHASGFLKEDGRLGLVLPAELLSVKYAAEVRRFLLNRFKRVRLVLFEELVFPGVLEDVVLLLAEGTGHAQCFEVYQAKNAEDLVARAPENWAGYAPREGAKWTSLLLPSETIALYESALVGGMFETMSKWGKTYLGAVTGNNDFFTLSRAEAISAKLSPSELLRVSPPGSRHLRGLSFSEHAWEKLTEMGGKTYLFSPSQDPSKAALSYIRRGEKAGVHEGYKCSNREPWWRVPLVERPDLLFSYMSHDRPRLLRNGAGVHLLNSLYGVKLHAGREEVGAKFLPIACLNSFTLLGAEVVGRAYGGGMLKHEPTEVGLLPVPSIGVLRKASKRLSLIENQVAGLLRQSDLTPAIDVIDKVVLKDCMGFKDDEVAAIKGAREQMSKRRMVRGRRSNGAS